MPIIAISGKHGSGKTTAAKNLAKKLGYKYISAGEIFREMAKKQGFSLEDFSKKAAEDTSIDKCIDQKTVRIAKEEDNLIVDAQLAGWLLKDVADLLVCISASFETRIERIATRENRSQTDVRSETLAREKSELSRYNALYSFDIEDLSIYDIIINTDHIDADTVLELLLVLVKDL